MLSEPVIQYRAAMSYAAIRVKVNQHEVPERLPPLIPEVQAWLAKHGVEPAGPPFFLYKSMDQEREMVAEVGIIVAHPVEADGYVFGDRFPAGEYVTIQHSGDYRNIRQGHVALEHWLARSGSAPIKILASETICWGFLAEFYLTDPAHQPDPAQWKAEIIYRLCR